MGLLDKLSDRLQEAKDELLGNQNQNVGDQTPSNEHKVSSQKLESRQSYPQRGDFAKAPNFAYQFEIANIRLECAYSLNQKDWKLTSIPFANARKREEKLFSQLTDQFLLIRNYAKETCGLFARIIGKVSALTALQYINYINDKPIIRIKYAMI